MRKSEMITPTRPRPLCVVSQSVRAWGSPRMAPQRCENRTSALASSDGSYVTSEIRMSNAHAINRIAMITCLRCADGFAVSRLEGAPPFLDRFCIAMECRSAHTDAGVSALSRRSLSLRSRSMLSSRKGRTGTVSTPAQYFRSSA